MSDSSTVIAPVGAVLQITQTSEGQYSIKQLPTEQPTPIVLHSDDRQVIDFDIKFIRIVGYYDSNTREIGITPFIAGARLGNGYYASLDNGIGIDLEYLIYSGRLSIGPDAGKKKLRLSIHLKGAWGLPGIDTDVDLFNI
ncbi:hypothetical protein G7Z17_g3111 [Cylindrodendrum hubeiense]|uniref:Uncharacterized protein n=1 Tax=Cylindrodendrum hubeiense TaxID=595255 RepID=A0A9P5LDV6_9HYPO|nr:hypothetical protein G7Z17_g3111 [Cylindrodendrum hubeiense]